MIYADLKTVTSEHAIQVAKSVAPILTFINTSSTKMLTVK